MSEHTQVGPYALGLLDPLEMSRFEEHLAECDECGTQLEWMLPVADLMADVEPGELFGIEGPSAFSAPGGSVQQPMAMTDPTTRPVPQAPAPGNPTAYPPQQYPDEQYSPAAGPRNGEFPRVDPYTGEIPRADPRTGSISRVDPHTGGIPAVDPRTGSIPRIDPRTGSMPTVDPRTGSISRVDPRSGSVPRVDPRTGSVPKIDSRTGEMPRVEPGTGENRIVPLVRGGDARRRSQPQSQQPARPMPRRPVEDDFSSRRRSGLMLAAAAAILGAAAGAGAVVSGPWANQSSDASTPSASARRVAATDSTTGVHADLSLDSKTWGTLVSFTVTDVDGPRKCRLVAELADGKSEVLSTWTVPEQGYSAGTKPPELTLQAATALNQADISALQVQDVNEAGNATTLVTVRS